MTIAEVVQRSGSSVGSLYARFNNKLGLLRPFNSAITLAFRTIFSLHSAVIIPVTSLLRRRSRASCPSCRGTC